MSKQDYPASLNCWLKGYPPYIRVTFGPEMENVDGPWGNGSMILLERIGFDDPITNPTPGTPTADVKVTYSDNGTDSDWIFKIGMYGWGTFFATTDPNYYVLLEKWVEFESTYFAVKRFRHRYVRLTEIPKTTSIPNVIVPVDLITDRPPEVINPTDPPSGLPLNVLDHAYLAGNLINAYWYIWNINVVSSVSVTKTATAQTNTDSWRQINGSTMYDQYLVDFWLRGETLLVTFSFVTIECDDFIFGEPLDCSYASVISAAYVWNTLSINGVNRLPDLVRRA